MHTTHMSAAPVGAAHAVALFALTIPSFLLAGACFVWWGQTGEVALLLLGWVTFGMAWDFFGHILGVTFPQRSVLLEVHARINFSALCFGIPFTALAGSFVLAEAVGGAASTWLVAVWPGILAGSLAFGALFLVARYRKVDVNGGVEYVLDKQHRYTRVIFVIRRILLAAALLVALSVVADAVGTPWLPWAMAFTGVFLLSVPLHIMHRQIPSMVSEVVTQVLAIGASWVVFVA